MSRDQRKVADRLDVFLKKSSETGQKPLLGSQYGWRWKYERYKVVSKHSRCSHTCGFSSFSGPLPEKRKSLVGIIPTPYKERRRMANRKRNIQMKFYVMEDEKRLIDEKMSQLPTRRYGACLRKMAIDGYIHRRYQGIYQRAFRHWSEYQPDRQADQRRRPFVSG